MVPQRCPVIVVPEKSALAQDRHHLLGEYVEPALQIRRHDIEAVGGTIVEPFLDLVGDLFGRPGLDPMAARPGEAVEQLADGWILALDDVEYDVEAAARTTLALDTDKLARKWPVQIVAGKIGVYDAA